MPTQVQNYYSKQKEPFEKKERRFVVIRFICWFFLFVSGGVGALDRLTVHHALQPHDVRRRQPVVANEAKGKFLVGKLTVNQSPSTLSSTLIQVPALNQNPELYNGCEVTSLAMLLEFAGHPVPLMALADEINKDPTPEVQDSSGAIVSWGDPNLGYVGDITGANEGYGVYHGPIAALLDQKMPGRAEDITEKDFTAVLNSVKVGHPVVAWSTVDFAPTSDWVTWQSPEGPIKATFDEHCVLIVGYDADSIYINDPLDGTAGKKLPRSSFIASWKQLGSQAVTYK